MKKALEWFIKFFIYAAFFAPLLVVPTSFIFPFIVPKILLFRSLVAFILGGYILLLFLNKEEYKIQFTPVNLVLSVFIVSFALSTFIGVDPYHSFWDNHERMLGLFTILHYFAYFIVCGAVFKNWKDWSLALKIFLFAGSIVMFIGAMQINNPFLLMNQGNDRVASTLGNPIYVSGYGLFLFFTALLLFAREKSNWWRFFEVVMAFFALLGIVYGGSRGAMLGFVAGFGALLLGYVIILKNTGKNTKKALWAVILFCVLLVALFYTNRNSEFVHKIPALGRFASISVASLVNSPRFIAWKIAIEGWRERPVFGWGPNNFFYAFNKYYNPKSLEMGYGETWFDNAHNIILNTLTVQGIFGLFSYLAIFIVAVISLWQVKENRDNNPHLVVIGSAFLVAHLVQNVTVFENPTSYLYFMFWLAMISRLGFHKKTPEEAPGAKMPNKNSGPYSPDKELGPGAVFVAGLAVFAFIFIFNIQPARANQRTLLALQTLNASLNFGLAPAKEALSFGSPHIDDIRSDLARTMMQGLNNLANSEAPAAEKQKSREVFNLAFSSLKKNLVLHPMDIRNHLILAQLGQVGAVLYNDAFLVYEAENFMQMALVYSPKRQQILYGLSNIKAQLGKKDEAVKLLEAAISYDPKIGESYWRLAYIYKVTGDDELARQTILRARALGLVFDNQGESIAETVMATKTAK